MALETGTYIDDLVITNPPQSDSLTQAAGHLRLIKSTIKATFPNVTGAISATHTELDAAATAVAAGQYLPAGAILPFAGSSTPTGYLLCYGQAVSRTTYSGLFTAISTTWGSGNGTTTFNVPDFRDRMLIGKADMGGTDAAIIDSLLTSTTLGATYDGEGAIDTITLAEANIPAHTHSFSDSFTGTTDAGGAHTHTYSGTTSTDGTHTHDNGSDANNGSVNVESGSNTAVADNGGSANTGSGGSHSHTYSGTTASSSTHTHTFSGTVSGTTGSAGSTTAFTVAILNPCAVVNFIIKT
jgi:microcystin-dependent protein